MRTDELEIVRFALAFHLNIDPEEIHTDQRLDEELGLDPLDLVLVVLRLEELGNIEFPVADLEGLLTVGDLVGLVGEWYRDAAPLEPIPARRETARRIPPPAPSESGFHRVVDVPQSTRTSRVG